MTKARDTSKLVSSVGVNTIHSLDSTNVNVTGIITATSISGVSTAGITTIYVGSGTTITSTTLTVNGNNYPTGGSFALRNRIINGDMRIDQRKEGSSFTFTTNGVFTLDRWDTNNNAGADRFSVQRNAGAVTPPPGFSHYLGATSSGANTPAAGDVFLVRQKIEGTNIVDLAWGTASAKTITLSFWVYSSLTGTFGGSLLAGGSAYSYPFSYTISSSNTWEYKTIVVPGPTGGTWVTTTSTGIEINFSLGTGSTYSGTAGSWSANDYRSSTGATNVVATSGATWYITGVQFEVGSVPTSFEFRRYDDELRSCRRYYQPLKIAGSNDGIAVMRGSSFANASEFIVQMIEPMRASATGTFKSGSDITARRLNGSSTDSTINVTLQSFLDDATLNKTYSYVRCRCASGGLVDTEPYVVWGENGTVVALMDAEL